MAPVSIFGISASVAASHQGLDLQPENRLQKHAQEKPQGLLDPVESPTCQMPNIDLKQEENDVSEEAVALLWGGEMSLCVLHTIHTLSLCVLWGIATRLGFSK